MARHRSPQGRHAGLGLLSPQFAMAGVGGMAGAFPAGPRVRHARPAGWSVGSGWPTGSVGSIGSAGSDQGSRISASAKVAAVVVAVGGLAGAAHVTSGSGALPSPAAWLDTSAAEVPAAAVPAPRAPLDAAPIADPSTIASLATPAAAGGSVAARTATVAPAMNTGAASAVEGASASVTAVQKAAAERARAVEAARAAGATGSLQAASAGGAVSIVSGRVTSGFGSRWGSQHMGLDIAAPIGTPINVPLGGTVISSGPASGFGMWVRVRHDDGTVTVYGHINRSLVSVGQKVAAGQQIAEVGNRGQSTGPHLHIEVVDPGGSKINPKPWLDANGFSYT
ncbi:M23 family metallopeptidase [Pseudonocardia sp. HH130630-07]|uniref:M23 family metallopeptidase n=1 Tax=Pseudonocardia sp. HH130630-07 TaxID=1690815 RepID=UPI000B2A29A1|nr:M23 family metallopeptidase [Pseudonocardia sp. HH130630-07]